MKFQFTIMFGLVTAIPMYAGGEQKINDIMLPQITVDATKANADTFDTSDSATEGTVNAKQIANRLLLRPAEVLETVPGLIVTQHSGDGKANQYFLRGFSLDHGTDFYTTLEDMPINLPTHAHGQGYSDLNFLIPELISDIKYKKGPYYASEGDFASTGSASIGYVDSLPYGISSVTVGSFGDRRVLNADSYDVAGGKLLYALEYFHNDGPWTHPERYERFNGVVSYAKNDGHNSYKISAMAYKGDWDATNQVPLRAINDGTIDRYGSLDPSDGGNTHRYSLSAKLTHYGDDATTTASAYIIDYGLDLFSNFTYYMNNPTQGDQFEQKDSRTISGANIAQVRIKKIFDMDSIESYGLAVRNDFINGVGLYNTQNRNALSTVSYNKVNETSVGLYYQNELTLADKVRVIGGIREDLYRFDVTNYTNPTSSGVKTAAITSPKLNFIFGPWEKTELFINSGYGFHSNDARGVMASSTAATPLVKTIGAEVGVQTRAIQGLQSSLTLWMMDSDSELVFAGDSGTTEATGPSRRIGVEWANYWTPFPWCIIDADFTLSQAHYRNPAQEGGAYVPEAMEKTVSIGAEITDYKNYFGGARLRYFGSRALIEDNSIRSEPSTLVNLKVGRHLGKNFDLSLDVLNLFNVQSYDIEYYYASQLKNESASVNDYMVHPGEPRSVRFTLTYKY